MSLKSFVEFGAYRLRNRAVLAPMAGITDRPFRTQATRFGATWTVSEMIASNALATGHRDMVRKLDPIAGAPHIVQLAGNEAEWLALGAKIAADAGADMIDINFGCPAKRVTNGYAGSALMRVPDVALGLIEAVMAATPVPVSVKMRLGWDDRSRNAADIARRAVALGVKMIVVHGRTRQQFYKGQADWGRVRDVVEAVDVPVIVNGDIKDGKSAREALRLSGAAGVMIGRGAQGRPWQVGAIGAALDELPGPDVPVGPALAELVKAHHADMLSHYGTELGVRVARKHLGWYLEANRPEVSSAARKRLLTATDPGDIARQIEALFTEPVREAA